MYSALPLFRERNHRVVCQLNPKRIFIAADNGFCIFNQDIALIAVSLQKSTRNIVLSSERGITGRNFSVARSAWKLYCSRKNSYREPQESASVSSVKKRLWGRKVVSSIRGYVLAERSRSSLWNTVPS